MTSEQQKTDIEKEPICDIAEKNHNRIDPKESKKYHLYSFSAYDDNQQNPVETLGGEINSAKYVVPDQSVLISKLNPRINRVWKVENAKKNSICSTEFIVLQPREDVRLNYLYAILNEPSFRSHLTQLTTGTSGSHQRVKQTDILNYEVPKFDEVRQSIIASIYGDLDKKIEVNKRIDKIIEQIAQALFKSWFINFDKYNKEMEYDEEFESDVPTSWRKVSLDTIADFLNGKAWKDYSSENEEENDLPVVKIKELRNGISDKSDRVVKSGCPKDYIIDNGDVIFSWSASLVLDMWSEGEAFLNQHLFKVTSQAYPRWFYYLWIDHHIRAFRHIADAKKTTMGHIKRSDLEEAKVLIPPEDELESMSKHMKPMFEKRIKGMIENKRLEELRDTVLPKLVSGEIKLDNITLDTLEVDRGV